MESKSGSEYGTTREWRQAILGDPANGIPGSVDALEAAQRAWLDTVDEAQQCLLDNSDRVYRRGSLHTFTHLLASVCDLGPASIDPTPLTDCYGIIASLLSRQSGRYGPKPADATPGELSQLEVAVNRSYSILNRLTHAWVALEGRLEVTERDSEIDDVDDDGRKRPRWDDKLGNLYFGHTVARHIRRNAYVCIEVLKEFEAEKWPPVIVDPTSGGRKNPERVNNAVRTLNKNNSLIRFSADGDGQSIRWSAKERTEN